MKWSFLAYVAIAATVGACDSPMDVAGGVEQVIRTQAFGECYPNEENNYDCGGGSQGSGDPCPGCDGLTPSGMLWSDCQASGRTDLDSDGLFDTCEFNLAHDFRPTLNTDLGDDCETREPYWAARPTGLSNQVRIFYAIGYHKDCGDAVLGIMGHEGDSEFVIVDISFNTATNRWVLDQAYLSAHYLQSNDHSRWYHHTDISYGMNAFGVVHQRGRPVVVVAEGKHANYATRGQCLLYERCGSDTMPYSLDIQASRNIGSNSVRLIDQTSSALGRSGTERMWTGFYFCGWSGTSCTTSGYGNILRAFGM